jgi:hypothetical protein
MLRVRYFQILICSFFHIFLSDQADAKMSHRVRERVAVAGWPDNTSLISGFFDENNNPLFYRIDARYSSSWYTQVEGMAGVVQKLLIRGMNLIVSGYVNFSEKNNKDV